MKDRELPLRRHLEDLRRRLTIAALAVVVTTVVSFIFYKQIIRFLLIPAEDLGPAIGGEGGLVFIQVTEMVAVTMKVSLISGLVLAFPVVLYQIVMFMAPGLTSKRETLPVHLYAWGAAGLYGGGGICILRAHPPCNKLPLELGKCHSHPDDPNR